MAIVKFGSIVTDIKGKLGGHAFQKGNQSHVLRTNSKPTLTQTLNNTRAQARVNQAIAAYSQLEDSLKLTWHNVAQSYTFKNRFSDNVTYTGRQLFLFLNNNLLKANSPMVLNPTGLTPDMSTPVFTSLTFDIPNETTISVGTGSVAGSRYVYNIQRLSRGSIGPNPNKYTRLQNAPLTNFVSNTIWNPYVLRFGPPAIGDNIWCSVYLVNEWGFKSYDIAVKCIII